MGPNDISKKFYYEPHTREMSKEERQFVMDSMSDNFDTQNEPHVGIFWYDTHTDELFGVNKEYASELQFNQNGLKTVKILHKTWWQKQKNKAISKGKDPGIFRNEYTIVPRGRIFQTKDGVFQLLCGKWVNDHIKNLVIDEFELRDVPFEVVIDTHWEIGHGWSEEYGL